MFHGEGGFNLEDVCEALMNVEVTDEASMNINYRIGSVLYELGKYQDAIELFELAANHGHSYSQYALALCYVDGTGVEVDLNKGLELLQLAADQGHKQAIEDLPTVQCDLGSFNYQRGQNISEAVRLLRLSSQSLNGQISNASASTLQQRDLGHLVI